VTPEDLVTVLAAFVGKDMPSNFDVPLSDDSDWYFCDLSGPDVDEALREAHHEGLIVCECRQGMDGSAVSWVNIRLMFRPSEHRPSRGEPSWRGSACRPC
jgi:hypothetical protein